LSEANFNAAKAGFCIKRCSVSDLERWAQATSAQQKGQLALWAKAAASKAGAQGTLPEAGSALLISDADLLAKRLGKNPQTLYVRTAEQAKKAGMCRGECTPQNLAHWGRSQVKDTWKLALGKGSCASGSGKASACPDRGFTLWKKGRECLPAHGGNGGSEKKLGSGMSMEQCAAKCRATKGCNFFVIGAGPKKGHCYWEYDAACRGATVQNKRLEKDHYDIYRSCSTSGQVDVGVNAFNALFKASPNHIIKRVCKTCEKPYREMYYKRLTKLSSFQPYDYMKNDWKSKDNILNKDFAIYSSFSDAVFDKNPWRFCNYDDAGIGFPRDCGMKHPAGGQWNTFQSRSKGQQDVCFYISESKVAKIYQGSILRSYSEALSGGARSAPALAALVAKALKKNPTTMLEKVAVAATAAGFCKGLCRMTDLIRWARQYGRSQQGAMKSFAQALAAQVATGAGKKVDTSLDEARTIAKMLKRDPAHMYKKASVAARDAGFCTRRICTPRKIREWARVRGSKMSGNAFASYARALAGQANSRINAALLVAAAKGHNPQDALTHLHKDAETAGFCVNRCTTAELIAYAQAKSWEKHVRKSTDLILKTLAGGASRGSSAERRMKDLRAAFKIATILGVSPQNLYAEAVSEAKKLNICSNRCTPVALQSWARKHATTLDGKLGAFARALAGEASSPQGVSALVVRAVGKKPEEVMEDQAILAKKAGFCLHACTQRDIDRWIAQNAEKSGSVASLEKQQQMAEKATTPHGGEWLLALGKGTCGQKDLGATAFDRAFQATRSHIIKRVCRDCAPRFKVMYYKRLTKLTTFKPYDYIANNWKSQDNVLNKDFAIYSTYADAARGQKSWKFCNYNKQGIGFPRDCGPKYPTGGQWNSWTTNKGQKDVCFYIDQSVKPKWRKALSKGAFGKTDLGATAFNRAFSRSKTHMIKRVCKGCAKPYRVLYYKRLTKVSSFRPYDYMKNNWRRRHNVINKDFAIYSSFSDAARGKNAWKFCNYDGAGIGFPRDCGVRYPAGGQWSTWASKNKGQKDVAFYIDVRK